jgi:hypothetical protein
MISYEFLGGADEPRRAPPAQGGGFGAAAASRAACGESDSARSSSSAKPKSAAQAYADKKRAAMEKAERLKAERLKAREQAWVGAGDDVPGFGDGPPMREAPVSSAQAAQNELDALHALGDKKFGRRR